MQTDETAQIAIHPSLLRRRIIHLDMDCYFAAIEMRDDPSLMGKPLVVGGDPQGRGVVATANYEARRFGVRSAMSCAYARKLCPQLIFLRPRFEVYRETSLKIRALMQTLTKKIEPVSLDEAYLDVTDALGRDGNPAFASQMARDLRARIAAETGLTASAGVAPNKMVAKIASDVRKPNGLTVVQPHEVGAFMQELPVRKIPFVGPVTEKRLQHLGIFTCRDLSHSEDAVLLEALGNHGPLLKLRAAGIDESEVETSDVRKSLGAETTFARDLTERAELLGALRELAREVAEGLDKLGLSGGSLTLKVKYHDFRQVTRTKSLAFPIHTPEALWTHASGLLDRTEATSIPVRLLGISVAKLTDERVPTTTEMLPWLPE